MKNLSRLAVGLALFAAPTLMIGCGEEAPKPVETPASVPPAATAPGAPGAPAAAPAAPAK